MGFSFGLWRSLESASTRTDTLQTLSGTTESLPPTDSLSDQQSPSLPNNLFNLSPSTDRPAAMRCWRQWTVPLQHWLHQAMKSGQNWFGDRCSSCFRESVDSVLKASGDSDVDEAVSVLWDMIQKIWRRIAGDVCVRSYCLHKNIYPTLMPFPCHQYGEHCQWHGCRSTPAPE